MAPIGCLRKGILKLVHLADFHEFVEAASGAVHRLAGVSVANVYRRSGRLHIADKTGDLIKSFERQLHTARPPSQLTLIAELTGWVYSRFSSRSSPSAFLE